MKKITILLADDHSIVRSGLRALLATVSSFRVVAEASNGEETITLAEQHSPDIIILDVSMPKLNGIETTRRLRQKNLTGKILILSIYENEEYVHQALQAGADGYLLKNAEKKEIVSAIKVVATGGKFFSTDISKIMLDGYVKRAEKPENFPNTDSLQLTKREKEILKFIAQGYTSQEIADKLFLSFRTVNTHRSNMMQKLDIHDTASLVRYAIQHGIVDPSS
ncbi:MAG: response regulator transcription factor [Ignavibacteriales bacterium]|nr:response regulator transcription factor [Ignavibacteriales bacterium]